MRDIDQLFRHLSPEVAALNSDLLRPAATALLPSGNKYGNHKVEVGGMRFDSKVEARRYMVLAAAEAAGTISGLLRQVPFVLLPAFTDNEGKRVRAITYIADFVYQQAGKTIIEDVKGKATQLNPTYRLKWKLLAYKFRDDKSVQLREVI